MNNSNKKKWSLIAGCGVLVVALGVFFITGGFCRNVPVQEDTPVIEGEEAVDLTLEDITDSKGKGTVTEVEEAIAKDPLKVDDAASGGKATEDGAKKDDSSGSTTKQPVSNPSGDTTQPSGDTIIWTEEGFVGRTADGHLRWGSDPNYVEPIYSCGNPNHHCVSEADHIAMLNAEAKGCPYCGAHDCPSLYSMDKSICPMYDITRDPAKYCQVCGLPRGVGPGYCSVMISGGFNCLHCGQYIASGGCHHCPGA